MCVIALATILILVGKLVGLETCQSLEEIQEKSQFQSKTPFGPLEESFFLEKNKINFLEKLNLCCAKFSCQAAGLLLEGGHVPEKIVLEKSRSF